MPEPSHPPAQRERAAPQKPLGRRSPAARTAATAFIIEAGVVGRFSPASSAFPLTPRLRGDASKAVRAAVDRGGERGEEAQPRLGVHPPRRAAVAEGCGPQLPCTWLSERREYPGAGRAPVVCGSPPFALASSSQGAGHPQGAGQGVALLRFTWRQEPKEEIQNKKEGGEQGERPRPCAFTHPFQAARLPGRRRRSHRRSRRRRRRHRRYHHHRRRHPPAQTRRGPPSAHPGPSPPRRRPRA